MKSLIKSCTRGEIENGIGVRKGGRVTENMLARMSKRSRNLPRRSCLSTPGSSDRFLAKAPSATADFSFLDLEDSVAPNEKVAARSKVVNAIRTLDWDDRVLCVRVMPGTRRGRTVTSSRWWATRENASTRS